MSELLLKVLPLGVFGSLIAVLTAGFSPAQEPIPLFAPGAQPAPIPVPVPRLPGADPDPVPLPLPGANPAQPAQPGEGPEVLAKGPVHEAFATTAEAPTAAPVVAKQPPEPIEELPPDQKPEGDNVQWIPGYWHWDEEGTKFIWISGFWRQPPPGRVWVPGSWREAKGGWQWVSGFWQEVNPRPAQPNQPQARPEIEYLPQPPETIEVGPTVPAPNETSFYVPGSWVWRGRYVWRPGTWVGHRANWLWSPARYHWTPAGYVFVDGYWDYPVATRGILFAPVVFVRPIHRGFVYTPVYVVSEPALVGALFVRRGCGNYYFGDYFDRRYVGLGYNPWAGRVSGVSFTIGFGTGRNWGYDPLFSYYAASYRNSPTWGRNVGDLYQGRYRGDVSRPPTTLVQQNTTINTITRTNVTNVTNNITVVNGTPRVGTRDVSNVAMVAPLSAAPDLNRTRFQQVSADGRRNEATAAGQLREVAAQRQRLETHVATQSPAVRPPVGQPAPRPQSIMLDVPKGVVARAQVNDERKAPPPNPYRGGSTITGNPNPKPDVPPVVPPRVDPRPPVVQPKNDPPRIDPRPPVVQPPVIQPKVDPRPPVIVPKNEPRPPVIQPKFDPPRIDPRPPVVTPKVEPRPPVVQPRVDPPKVEPKPPVVVPKVEPKPPVVQPRVEPRPPVIQPKVEPKPPVIQPRVDPPKPPVVQPRVDPPRIEPKPPVIQPRVEPKPPVVQPKVEPRPPVIQPRVEPPKVAPRVDPPKAIPPAQPRTQPAPVGKPPAKGKGRDE